TICYRDSASRVDKQRQNRTITSDTSDRNDRDSYDIKRFLSYLKESISSESSSSGSCMSSSSEDTVNTCKTKWLIFSSLVVLALMLPIISYRLDVNSIERPTSYDLVPTSPVCHKCTNQSFGNLMMHIQKLQTELCYLKEILNYQLTDANFWTNFALESDGSMDGYKIQHQLGALQHVEALFHLRGVTEDYSRYYLVVAALDQKSTCRIMQLLRDQRLANLLTAAQM
ncbi:hypothetical protein D4764_0287200, partial [Takifugu flavidus]